VAERPVNVGGVAVFDSCSAYQTPAYIWCNIGAAEFDLAFWRRGICKVLC